MKEEAGRHQASAFPEEYWRGIELFNRGDFFEAHEVWESLWLVSTGPEKIFLQALIQSAVALYHYELERYGAAKRTFERARQRFEKLPSPFMCLEIGEFLGQLEEFFRYTVSDAQSGRHRPTSRPAIHLREA